MFGKPRARHNTNDPNARRRSEIGRGLLHQTERGVFRDFLFFRQTEREYRNRGQGLRVTSHELRVFRVPSPESRVPEFETCQTERNWAGCSETRHPAISAFLNNLEKSGL